MNKQNKDLANAIRFLSIDAVEKANSGHPGLPMGMADVVTILFKYYLKFNPKNPNWMNRDRFILSAGHGSMLLYSLLYLTGYKSISLDDIKKDLSAGKSNPRNLKRQLAREIVQIYHDKDTAQKAESDFDALFIKKDIPDDIPEYALSSTETLVSIMVSNELVSSNGDAKRMIKQGAVKLDDEKISDMFFEVSPDSEKVLKVGKRKFLRITV